MKRFILPSFLTLTFFLAACSAATPTAAQVPDQPASTFSESTSTSEDEPNALADLLRTDSQGAVTIAVTPLDLSDSADMIDFEISLNTHSVDLSMDLATLATLTTDTSISVQAIGWDAPRGGHHVSGKLTFPATKDGKSILEGAGKLTLTIIDVDVPSRIFEWQLK